VNKFDKRVRNIPGYERSLCEETFEEKMKRKILMDKTILKGYKLLGNPDKIQIGGRGKKKYEIELCGELMEIAQKGHPKKNDHQAAQNGHSQKASTEPHKIGLAVGIKNKKGKGSIADVRKFVSAMKSLAKEKGYARVVGILVFVSGFSGPAEAYLKKIG
jgi:hypothetical protein